MYLSKFYLLFAVFIAALSSAHTFMPSVKTKTCKTHPSTSSKYELFDPNSLEDSYNFWLNAEALFWQANMGSLCYGTTSKSTTRISDGHVKEPHFNWDYGFRLGLGYKLPHDKWDLFANYTYVHGNAHGSENSSSRVIFPTYAFNSSGISPFYADSAHAHWRMTLNMIDVELGRTCFVSRWLSMRPFLSVRGLFIDQDYHVSYRGGTVAPFNHDKVHMDNDFWGAGIRMGVNALWGLGKRLSIYSNGSFSLLSGHFNVHEWEKREDQRVMSIKNDVDNVVVTADLALGLQWDYMFSKDRYHFGAKLGWEFDVFVDQNQLFNFLGSGPGAIHFSDDDLTFQGITLGFRFDF